MLKETCSIATILIILLGTSCQEDEAGVRSLDGTWIESADRLDTLIFKENEDFFILNRGKEERNGHLLPKYGSGVYLYELRQDTISIRNMVSSYSGFYNVFVKVGEDQLTIGDFYQKDTLNPQLLMFEKLQ